MPCKFEAKFLASDGTLVPEKQPSADDEGRCHGEHFVSNEPAHDAHPDRYLDQESEAAEQYNRLTPLSFGESCDQCDNRDGDPAKSDQEKHGSQCLLRSTSRFDVARAAEITGYPAIK